MWCVVCMVEYSLCGVLCVWLSIVCVVCGVVEYSLCGVWCVWLSIVCVVCGVSG